MSVHGNKLGIQAKLSALNLSSHPSLLYPPMASSGRDWLREAAEETHLPSLPALPQECFSSGPLSPMCRRPLCRVCFACKAGCRCCPQKSAQEGQGTRTQGGPTTMPPAWPRLTLLPPPSAAPASNTSHYFTPSMVPISIPGSTCHPSVPSPTRPTIPLPPS